MWLAECHGPGMFPQPSPSAHRYPAFDLPPATAQPRVQLDCTHPRGSYSVDILIARLRQCDLDRSYGVFGGGRNEDEAIEAGPKVPGAVSARDRPCGQSRNRARRRRLLRAEWREQPVGAWPRLRRAKRGGAPSLFPIGHHILRSSNPEVIRRLRATPPCGVSGCYPDYFAATGAIAIDGAGGTAFAYSFSSVTNGPKSLFVSTSSNGLTWTAPTLVNGLGDSNVPQMDRGPVSGDFRLGLARRSDWEVQHLVCTQLGWWHDLERPGSALECGVRCPLQECGRLHLHRW